MSSNSTTIKSMTAFGRGSCSFSAGVVTVEIQSVNRRHLEINVSSPDIFRRFDVIVKKLIERRIGRGMINVYIEWKVEANDSVTVTPNIALAIELKNAWQKISQALALDEKITLSLLNQTHTLFAFDTKLPDEKIIISALEKSVDEAVNAVMLIKEKEGEVILIDLNDRIEHISEMVSNIEKQAPQATEKYRAKLTERLNEILSSKIEHDERLLREVAMFAEKVDITEEIVRFKSHLTQLAHVLGASKDSTGKTIEFFLQELQREINTIGAKASDANITQQVILVKGEIEKMREQVQNVE